MVSRHKCISVTQTFGYASQNSTLSASTLRTRSSLTSRFSRAALTCGSRISFGSPAEAQRLMRVSDYLQVALFSRNYLNFLDCKSKKDLNAFPYQIVSNSAFNLLKAVLSCRSFSMISSAPIFVREPSIFSRKVWFIKV